MPSMSKGSAGPTHDYREYLLDRLKKSRERQIGYLTAALEETPDVFLICLKDVVDAQGGVTKLAKKTGMHRVSLHNVLSAKGNPRLDTLSKILAALGIRLALTPLAQVRKRKKAS